MDTFRGKIAVVTGGGTGMGRELAKQLATEGCHVALCDVSAESMAETKAQCERAAPSGTRVSTHHCDVSEEPQVEAFRDAVRAAHATDCVHLLFNNAGIGGGGSFVTDSRESWEKTFNVCWGGVYWTTRAFLPMLLKANEAHIVNTSSVNGFWASLGPMTPHTAYSAAKFAVKGFTEALITDLRVNAPHVKCSVVMPGHIGTEIAANSRKVQAGRDSDELTAEELAATRERMKKMGVDVSRLTDANLNAQAAAMANNFRDNAPMSAAQAAAVILDGVKAERWRILVGDDAHRLDEAVRAAPEKAYDGADFAQLVASAARAPG